MADVAMKREGKAAGSRVAAAHVGLLCVLYVVFCGCVLCGGATFSYHTGRKPTSAKAK